MSMSDDGDDDDARVWRVVHAPESHTRDRARDVDTWSAGGGGARASRTVLRAAWCGVARRVPVRPHRAQSGIRVCICMSGMLGWVMLCPVLFC